MAASPSPEGGEDWAVIATLIENCQLAGFNPDTWLTDSLAGLAIGHSANGVGELMFRTAMA